MRNLGAAGGPAGRKMRAFGGIVGGLSSPIGLAVTAVGGLATGLINIGQEFDNARASVQRATGSMGKDLEAHMKEVKKVFASLPDDMQSVAASYGAAATLMAGSSKQSIAEMTRQTHDFARIAGGSATEITDALGRAGTAFGLNAQEVASAIDVMTGAAQKWGIDGQKLSTNLQKFGPVFKLLGLDIEETTALFGSLYSAGVDVTRVSPAFKMFAERVSADGGNVRQELGAVIEQIKGAATETEGLAIAQDRFGKEGAARLVVALRSGAIPALQELGGAAEGVRTSTQKVADESATNSEKMREAWNKLKVAVEPLATALINWLTDIIDSITQIINLIPGVNVGSPSGTTGSSSAGGVLTGGAGGGSWLGAPQTTELQGQTGQFFKSKVGGKTTYHPIEMWDTWSQKQKEDWYFATVHSGPLPASRLPAAGGSEGGTAVGGTAIDSDAKHRAEAAGLADLWRQSLDPLDYWRAFAEGQKGQWQTDSADTGASVANALGAALSEAREITAEFEEMSLVVECFGQDAVDQALELGATREELFAIYQQQVQSARDDELNTILGLNESVSDTAATIETMTDDLVTSEMQRAEVLKRLTEEELQTLLDAGATVEQIWQKIEAHSDRMLDAMIDAALNLEDISTRMKSGPGGGVLTPENGMQRIDPNDPLFWTPEQRRKNMPLHKQIERDWIKQGGEILDRPRTEQEYNEWKTFRDAHPAARGGPLAPFDRYHDQRNVWARMTPAQQEAARKAEERKRVEQQITSQLERKYDRVISELERKLSRAADQLERAAGKQDDAATAQMRANDPDACGPREHHVFTAAGIQSRAEYRARTGALA